VHWRAKDLDSGRRDELRHVLTLEFLHSIRKQVHWDSRCEQRWEVEGGEDCEAVAESEEGVGRGWKWARSGGTEEAGEMRVLPEAEGEVGEGGCSEFGGAVSRGGVWGVAESGGCRVDGVCG